MPVSSESNNLQPENRVQQVPTQATFRTSPLVWITLLSLYLALTIPLPYLAQVTGASVSPIWLCLGIGIGGIALFAALSDRVQLDEQGIQVDYPVWVPQFFRQGWSLSWAEVQGLKPRSTGQGGLVYYLLSTSGQAYLLPMRVVGFARLVRQVEARTGIDMTAVRPLAQPWMYLILLGLTLVLFLVDGSESWRWNPPAAEPPWVFWTAFTQSGMS